MGEAINIIYSNQILLIERLIWYNNKIRLILQMVEEENKDAPAAADAKVPAAKAKKGEKAEQ